MGGSTGNGAAVGSAQRRAAWLAEAKTRAGTKEPVGVTVRQLLGYWNQKRRGSRVAQQVETDLTNRGLVTLPDFLSVTIDEVVYLVDAPKESEATAGPAAEEADRGNHDVGLKVGHLPSALGGVLAVKPEASYEEAVTKMLLNDYSQIAVMPTPHSLKGAVTWRSIAQARHADPDGGVRAALVPAHRAAYDDELIDILPTLAAFDFVFVTGPDRDVRGIVTTADVVTAYGDLATPFLLIGELDQTLRRVVEGAFVLDEVVDRCGEGRSEKIGSFDDLTMGDYQRVLENPACWARLGWPLDRAVFVARLDEIREIRNDVMHFDPDPLPDDAIPKLRNFLRVLRSRAK
jgi:CBS domain-containing protein